MGQTPDASSGTAERHTEEPEAAQESDIPTDNGTVQDDMTIERDDLPPLSERE